MLPVFFRFSAYFDLCGASVLASHSRSSLPNIPPPICPCETCPITCDTAPPPSDTAPPPSNPSPVEPPIGIPPIPSKPIHILSGNQLGCHSFLSVSEGNFGDDVAVFNVANTLALSLHYDSANAMAARLASKPCWAWAGRTAIT